MKKIILLVLIFIPMISGCVDEQANLANESKFNIEFTEINKDDKKATFTVSGLPNEEEFNQIPSIITDSMKNQEILVEDEYTINVRSKIEENLENNAFGSLKYKDGVISENQLKNLDTESYINLIK